MPLKLLLVAACALVDPDGRVLIAESAEVDRMAAVMTNYIARRLVERGVHLVEDTERRRLCAENREKQRDGRHGLFAAGHERDGAQFLARRAREHFDAGFEDIRFVLLQHQIAPAAAE